MKLSSERLWRRIDAGGLNPSTVYWPDAYVLTEGLKGLLRKYRVAPRGLKPRSLGVLIGTAKAVPPQNRIVKEEF